MNTLFLIIVIFLIVLAVFDLVVGVSNDAVNFLNSAIGATAADGTVLTLGDLLNTEKAISVILGIFLSVAIAFLLGIIVQWVARIVFTFTYRVNGRTTDQSGRMGGLVASSLKIGIFSGLSVTAIVWFLLINGLKGSSLMTHEVKEIINENTWLIIVSKSYKTYRPSISTLRV